MPNSIEYHAANLIELATLFNLIANVYAEYPALTIVNRESGYTVIVTGRVG